MIFLFLFLTKRIKPLRDYYNYLEYKNFILKKGVDKINDLSNCHYDYFDVKYPQHNKGSDLCALQITKACRCQ